MTVHCSAQLPNVLFRPGLNQATENTAVFTRTVSNNLLLYAPWSSEGSGSRKGVVELSC